MGEAKRNGALLDEASRRQLAGADDVRLALDEACVVMAIDLACGQMQVQAQQLAALGRPEGSKIFGGVIDHLQKAKALFVAETQRKVVLATTLPRGDG